VGPGEIEIAEMLESLDLESLDALVRETVPAEIRLEGELSLPPPLAEPLALAEPWVSMENEGKW